MGELALYECWVFLSYRTITGPRLPDEPGAIKARSTRPLLSLQRDRADNRTGGTSPDEVAKRRTEP